MKVFLLAVLCALAVGAYADVEEIDYDLIEDYGFLADIRTRIQKGLEAALDRINALVEKHKPDIENLKEKVAAIRERVANLAKETGRKFREALQNVRNKVRQFLREVINKISKKVEGSADYALYAEDDQTPLQKFAERIRDFIKANFQKLSDFINKHKELLSETIKQKLADLKEKISELAKEHGTKFLEHAREIGAKIAVIFRELLGKVSQKEEYALYAAEQEEESFLEALKRRVIERIQNAVDKVKERLAEVKSDITEKVLPKLEEIREKLGQLTKESGEKLLEIAGSISQKIREIYQQIRQQITGSYLYADEDAKEEEKKEEEDTTLAQRIAKRIQSRLNAILRGVKNLLARHKEIAESFKDKVQEVATAIAELTKQKGKELREAARGVAAKIRALRKSIFEKITGGSYYQFDITSAVRTLRDFFVTDEGIIALKDNAAKANPSTPTGQLIKAFVLASTPNALKDLIRELFKGIYLAPVGAADDIEKLVRDASAWLQTDAGIQAIRAYAQTIQTSHPVVLRLIAMLSSASNAAIKEVIADIFTIHF